MFNPKEHCGQRKITQRQHVRWTLRWLRESDNLFLDDSVTTTEDKRTDLAKNDATNAKCKAFDSTHGKRNTANIGLAQRGCNMAYSMSSAFNRMFKKLNKTRRHVSCASHNSVGLFNDHTEPIMITYNSGADGNYTSERDCIKAGLPILRQSTRKVRVANGG